MIKSVIFTLVLFCCSANAYELKHAAGIGLQYGSIVGYQLSAVSEHQRIRGAIGLIGASIGYDYSVTTNMSIGATYTSTLRSVYSLNFNYYLNSNYQGTRFSIDFAHMPDTDGEGFFATNGSKNAVWIGVGYMF